MSKKRFTTDLEDLFGVPNEEVLANDGLTILKKTNGRFTDDSASSPVAEAAPAKAKRSSKNFTSDLDSLFDDAFNEAVEKAQNNIASFKQQGRESRLRTRKPLTGLDALIRQTVEINEVRDHDLGDTKRLTITVDKTKLQRLKEIAKQEKSYIKDIIQQMVTEYINQHEKH